MIMRLNSVSCPKTSKQEATAALQKQTLLLVSALLIASSVTWSYLFTSVAADRPLTAAEYDLRNRAYQDAEPIALPAVQPEAKPDERPAEQFQDRVWLTLWDDCAEDGDVVFVSSGGLGFNVSLTRQPMRLAVNRPTDGVLHVHGVFDGGGGITVALASAYGPVPLPVMAPGQTVAVSVR